MRPLHSRVRGARRHRFGLVPASLALGVLAAGGCGGGSDEASQPAADEPRRTATPSVTATEPSINEAPPVDRARIRASAVSFRLRAENDSGLSGRAVVQRSGRRGTEVLLALSQHAGATNYAHFHDTSCAAYRGMTFNQQLATIVDNLQNVAQGRSTTIVDVPTDERTTGGYSINVHEAQEPFMVVACGDVPKR